MMLFSSQNIGQVMVGHPYKFICFLSFDRETVSLRKFSLRAQMKSSDKKLFRNIQQYTKSVVKLNDFFPKHNYPLPYYQGHYFRDTPVTMPHWHVTGLTVLTYSSSL